ncbi:MAG: ABC transporter ATP-binding protein [Planctomycetota bacterium]|nr:ABC transporter ATP-binding protein [Planctomycetota bacterium]
MTENAIEAIDLRKTYSDSWFRSNRYTALKGVSFAVPRGEIFGLLGPNGAGKTTFVKIMLGIVARSGGDANVMGADAGSQSARLRIGYLPENLRMRRHHTANTALEFYGGLNGLSVSEVRKRRGDLLKKVGLESWADAGIKKYSKGMLQRLGLAQAILHDPDLLILDEPTDGLDPQARADVREIMLQLKNEGKTIFVNSHILQEVELVCDSVAILDLGVLKYCGSVENIGNFISSQSGMRTGSGITFWLDCDEAKLRATLEVSPTETVTPRGEGRVEYFTDRLDVQFVNECIDRLRANDVRIIEISQKHVSLEQAFLAILSKESPSNGGNQS